MEFYRTVSAALIVAGLSAIPGMAFAESSSDASESADMRSLNSVKLTTTQAAQAAETKIGGKTSSVEFHSPSSNSPDAFYHVEVASSDGIQHDVAVDANSGEVMKYISSEDEQDSDKNNEEGEHKD